MSDVEIVRRVTARSVRGWHDLPQEDYEAADTALDRLESQNQALQEQNETLRELDRAHQDCHDLTKMRALQERAEKAEARVAKLQSVGAEAIKLLRVLAEFYDTADKLLQETPPDSDDYEGGGPG